MGMDMAAWAGRIKKFSTSVGKFIPLEINALGDTMEAIQLKIGVGGV